MKEIINIVIPMAWLGSRFAREGFKQIKPLINVKWRPMFDWAVSSFNFLKECYEIKFIFIILNEHIKKYDIDKYIQKLYNNSLIIPLDSVTKWQAESVYKAKEFINNDNMLIIYNSDTYSEYDLKNFPINKDWIDGIIPCFYSNNPNYSYVKTNNWWYATEVAEKKVISNNATNGLYYFKRWSDFINSIEKMMKDNITSEWEFYVWPVYNYLIDNEMKIITAPIKENWILWTPEELEYFLKNYREVK